MSEPLIAASFDPGDSTSFVCEDRFPRRSPREVRQLDIEKPVVCQRLFQFRDVSIRGAGDAQASLEVLVILDEVVGVLSH